MTFNCFEQGIAQYSSASGNHTSSFNSNTELLIDAVKQVPSAAAELAQEAWSHPGATLSHMAITLGESAALGTVCGALMPSTRAAVVTGALFSLPIAFREYGRFSQALTAASASPSAADIESIAQGLSKGALSDAGTLTLGLLGGTIGSRLGNRIANPALDSPNGNWLQLKPTANESHSFNIEVQPVVSLSRPGTVAPGEPENAVTVPAVPGSEAMPVTATNSALPGDTGNEPIAIQALTPELASAAAAAGRPVAHHILTPELVEWFQHLPPETVNRLQEINNISSNTPGHIKLAVQSAALDPNIKKINNIIVELHRARLHAERSNESQSVMQIQSELTRVHEIVDSITGGRAHVDSNGASTTSGFPQATHLSPLPEVMPLLTPQERP